MSPLRKFTLRLVLYGLVLAYLAGDLFVFNGPLRRRINLADPTTPEAIAKAKSAGVVARVFNHQITRGQLERAVHERLWLEGRSPQGLNQERLKITRYAALDDLIDHALLRVKAKANAPALIVSSEEIDNRLKRMQQRFGSREAMEQALQGQGIGGVQELRDRLAARIQQEKYAESRIGPLVEVSDGEAREWFEANRDALARPERVEVRHVFLPTLDHPPEEAKARLEAAMAELSAGTKDFATLARELSEDPASKDQGGSLGWMSRQRLPVDFAAPVFAMETGKPGLVRTRIGWHLVEVTGRKPAEPRSFEEAREEVIAALRTVKRERAVAEFRAALRQFEAKHIQVFHDMIAD
jgi:parvulin-like peptidyl-prolyl isomerase